MGTYYRVTTTPLPDGVGEADVRGAVAARLGEIDTLMSTYRSDSEVSRFNRSRGTAWHPVSAETAAVVAGALEIYELSEGAFDITVGPLVDLWGFGPSGGDLRIPDPDSVAAALANTGARHLSVRLAPPALKKATAGLQIDLSGIAKGYAVDSVAAVLERLGIDGYLVDVGGEMIASGTKAEGVPWRIAIERPDAAGREIHKVMTLGDMAIATSGNYRNFFDAGGKRYSHEIDPQTGRPIPLGVVSVSVLAPSCMRADAWATALIVAGLERGSKLAERAGLAALFISEGGGELLETETTGFRRLTEPH